MYSLSCATSSHSSISFLLPPFHLHLHLPYTSHFPTFTFSSSFFKSVSLISLNTLTYTTVLSRSERATFKTLLLPLIKTGRAQIASGVQQDSVCYCYVVNNRNQCPWFTLSIYFTWRILVLRRRTIYTHSLKAGSRMLGIRIGFNPLIAVCWLEAWQNTLPVF
jgi:hypothetical protein